MSATQTKIDMPVIARNAAKMMPWKFLMQCLSPGRGRGKLLVFIFHRVLARPDPLLAGEPDAITFDWMVRFISQSFNVLPFGTAVEQLKSGDLPAGSACITFDDGYRDNFDIALPILQRHGVQATFFIATDFLDGGRMWNDDVIEAVRNINESSVDWADYRLGSQDLSTQTMRCQSLGAVLGKLKYFPHEERAIFARQIARRAGVSERSDLMMSCEEVRGLRTAGMEVGAHTRSHPILSGLTNDQAMSEISGGKTDLEVILDESVNVFAYPNGNPERDLSSRDVELIAAAGFSAAATTAWGVATRKTDAFLIPRFTPWDRTYHRFAARTVLALTK